MLATSKATKYTKQVITSYCKLRQITMKIHDSNRATNVISFTKWRISTVIGLSALCNPKIEMLNKYESLLYSGSRLFFPLFFLPGLIRKKINLPTVSVANLPITVLSPVSKTTALQVPSITLLE